jgi:flagella basal body P-ring formation protein FlgA
MWRVSVLLLVAAHAPASDCLSVRGDQITAADLAPLAPSFGTLPPAARMAWAPVPGVTRWISPGELARIGRQQGIAAEPVGICVAQAVETLDRERVLAAMRRAGADYTIELLSFGPRETPPGRIEFSVRRLPPLPRRADIPAVQWRGHLINESGRAYPIWARARITVRRTGLVTVAAIGAGELLNADALRPAELIEYPAWEAPLADPELPLGRRARRAIAAGSPVLPRMLSLRRDVERGDSVEVELPGEATLTAQAESPGRTGETILLRNPLTGRRFPCRVTGVGRARVTPEHQAKVANDDHP